MKLAFRKYYTVKKGYQPMDSAEEDSINTLDCMVKSNSLDVSPLTECFRKLRNLCANGIETQNRISANLSNLDNVSNLFDKVLELPTSEENLVCLRLGCQFLGNLIVNNTVNQRIVHTKCFKHLRKLMLIGDKGLSMCCSMVIYNILLTQLDACNDIMEDNELLKEILKQESEFSTFIVEKLVLEKGEIEKFYVISECEDRLALLDIVRVNVTDNRNIPEKCIKFIAKEFKMRSDKILKIVSTYADSLEPREVCLLLETLASLSSDSPYLEMLQTDKSLFINCAFLLRSIHEAGSAGNNCFTSVRRLSLDNELKAKDNPVFGFKADLIRILGNLCYKHKGYKDLIRELECIPILLECCNIDENNPFIIQWSVLAIRNLCENSSENQAFIAGLSQKGVVPSPVLEELGYTLHSDGGKDIKIVPLKR